MRHWTTSTAIEVLDDHLVVVKRRAPAASLHETAESPGRRAVGQIRRQTEAEAVWLLAARGHAVVTVRTVDPDTGALSTDLAGMHTLRTTLRRSPRTDRRELQTIAAMFADVAAIVAGLHRCGLVHGKLTLDHVVLTGPTLTSPVLCSPAGRAGDGRTGDGMPEALDPLVDVEALAKMVAKVEPGAGRLARRWNRSLTEIEARAPHLGVSGLVTTLNDLAGRKTRSRRPIVR